jgi:hypothetical protein
MFAVQGIYADGTVTINEPVPVNKNYDVIVTFLKPSEQIVKNSKQNDALPLTMAQIEEWAKTPEIQSLVGVLKGTGLPEDISIHDIRNQRLEDKYTV